MSPDTQQHTHSPDEFQPYRSYSQDGEDMLLRGLLTEAIPQYAAYKGFYIDIGAYHPFRFSNTMHYYELGWKGINIEPTPDHIALFSQHRDRDINLNIGIGTRQAEMQLYCFNDSSLNTFDKDVADLRMQQDAHQLVNTLTVSICTLEQVLDQYVQPGTVIDFMNIDIAGLDVEVLQSNNWDKYKPGFILLEDTGNDLQVLDASELHDFLTSKGYEQLATKTLRTLLYQQKRHV